MNGKSSGAFKSHKNSSNEAKQPSQQVEKNKRAASMFEFFELKKDPKIFKNLVDAAEFIEKYSDSMVFEFSFKVECNTQYGESIVVTGGIDFLGNWEPSQGLILQWTEPRLWRGTLLLTLESFVGFEYKYVLVNADSALWEKGPNRSCTMALGNRTSTHTKFKLYDAWEGY